jgi:phage-related protein
MKNNRSKKKSNQKKLKKSNRQLIKKSNRKSNKQLIKKSNKKSNRQLIKKSNRKSNQQLIRNNMNKLRINLNMKGGTLAASDINYANFNKFEMLNSIGKPGTNPELHLNPIYGLIFKESGRIEKAIKKDYKDKDEIDNYIRKFYELRNNIITMKHFDSEEIINLIVWKYCLKYKQTAQIKKKIMKKLISKELIIENKETNKIIIKETEHNVLYFHIILAVLWEKIFEIEKLNTYYAHIKKNVNTVSQNVPQQPPVNGSQQPLVNSSQQPLVNSSQQPSVNSSQQPPVNSSRQHSVSKLYKPTDIYDAFKNALHTKITLFEQGNRLLEKTQFVDCQEVTLLNFIKIIIKNDSDYDINLLDTLKPIDKLLEFLRSVIDDFNSEKVLDNEKRNLWANLLSNIPDVSYNRNDKYEVMGSPPRPGKKHNILTVLQHLFQKENLQFEDFAVKVNGMENILEVDLNSNGIGSIKITKKYNNNLFGEPLYIYHLQGHHSFLKDNEKNNNVDNLDITHLNDNNKYFFLHIYNIDHEIYYDKDDNLTELTFGDNFNQPLGPSLNNLTNLKQLTFKYYFNQQLGTSLQTLTNLQQLTFGSHFSQPLGPSLNNLTNLQQLTFGSFFRQPLGESLDTLTKLEQLTLGSYFNQELGTSLHTLINLQQLTLGDDFNQPLGISLNNLTNLQQLTFGDNFNQPLGISLNNLTNLKQLTFKYFFNQQLGTSLQTLTNLQQLTFGDGFNKLLGPFGFFDRKLVISLNNLTNLQQLTFGDDFNKPLGDSLSSLINLKELTFGKRFNQELGTSLNNLTNLQQLKINNLYQGNSILDKIPNITYIH